MDTLSTRIEITERTLFLLQAFAIGAVVFGLALDLLTLTLYLTRTRSGKPAPTGLPLVPAMLYFSGGFFWFLRGNPGIAFAVIFLFILWHILLHWTLYRLSSQKPSTPR